LRSLVTDGRVEQQPSDAETLCQWLGYLPLGLELVGRYLANKPDVSPAEMKRRLEQKRLQHPATKNAAAVMTAQLGIEAAFELSWQELDNGAQRLGGLLSLFALAPLPWEMVEQCLADEDGEELEDCRDRLKHLHLVQRIDPGIYQLHPLIQQFFGAKLNNRADAAELRSAVAATAANIASGIPQSVELKHVTQFQLAIPHLESVAAHHQAAIVDEDLFSLFSGLVRFYYGQGLYVQAEVWSKSCLAVTQEKLGDRHPAVAQSLNNLAALHSKTRFL
jgi:hypothetical protein